MQDIELRLLKDFQREFPLDPRPYRAIGGELGVPETEIIHALRRLCGHGVISRIGATIVPGRLGAATLAAMRVAPVELERVAALVSSYPEVNHNYEREGDYNLWFVVTAPSEANVRAVVRDVEERARCGRTLSLPMVEAYHVDLGFDLNALQDERRHAARRESPVVIEPTPYAAAAAERALLAALQDGLSFTLRPYAELATRAGMSEDAAIAAIDHLVRARVIGRLGVIVRHRELGFHANAMAVWDVPDEEAREHGLNVARARYVTLCYRRRRELLAWPYNLYCMIHGTSRRAASARIAELNESCGLAQFPHAVLFSRRCFKQRGARYVEERTYGRDRPPDRESHAERVPHYGTAVP